MLSDDTPYKDLVKKPEGCLFMIMQFYMYLAFHPAFVPGGFCMQPG